MSYTVIARRYRPQTFEEVIGQSAIATTLQNAIKEGKTSHAYIFAGERGVGKTSLARIFAKALNCKKGPTATPCNKCEFCLSIAEGNDPDVIEIDAASRTKVEDVRELQEGIGYVPLRARYKVYIMDEAHQLSRGAFNALLKTIEEPPPHVKFIFATTEPQRLPETIISRCQRFNFRRISPQDIYQHLETICTKEKVACDKATLALIAQLAQGSMRDAETVLDQLISFGGGKVTGGDIELLLGAVSLEEVFKLVEAVHQADLKEIITIIDDAFNQGKDMAVFFDQVIEHLWRLILIKVNPKDSPLVKREIIQERERYEKQSGYFTVKTLLDDIQQVSDARWRLKETTNVRVLAELVLMKMAAPVTLEPAHPAGANPVRKEIKPVPPTPEMNPKKEYVEVKPAVRETAAPDKSVVKEVNPPADPEEAIHTVGEAGQIGEYWGQIMESIRQSNFKIHAYLREARFVRADNQEVVIGFPPHCSFHRRMFDDPKNKKVVEEHINKVTGHNLPVMMVLLEESQTSGPAPDNDIPPDTDTKFIMRDKTASAGKDDVIKSLLNNPIIRKVQEEFDARIIKVDEQ